MNNYQADPIQDIINIVNRIGGITDFLSIYPMDKGLEEFYKDLLQFTSSSDSGLNESEKQLFSDLEIAVHLYLEKFETNCLYYVNNDKMLDEGDLDEFRHDWEQSKTGKETFKESSIRRYKTYTDFYKYELHDSDLILSKYQDAVHPLINAMIAESLNESSMMYRYGDSRPNLSDITPMSINDDVSYDDLKVMAIHRADAVACKIYKNFSNHVLEFSLQEIQELIINLREVYYNISPKDDFFEIFNALEQVFNKKHYVRIADLLTCMKTIEPKCGKYECFNHILQNIQNCNMDYVGKGLLDSILENYRKIERNFNWGTEENTTITDIFKNDGKKEYHDIGIDETDASASYDDQGNLFK